MINFSDNLMGIFHPTFAESAHFFKCIPLLTLKNSISMKSDFAKNNMPTLLVLKNRYNDGPLVSY